MLNVANGVTVLRLLLVPVFVVVYWQGRAGSVSWSLAAVAVFLCAAATDKLDGYLARARNLVTDFGKLADPIADKALIAAGLICLWANQKLSWIAVAVILLREVVVTVIRLMVVRQQVMAASTGGKLKTLLQVAAIGLYILMQPWPEWTWLAVVAGVTMIAAVAVTVFTGVEYVYLAWPYLAKKPKPATEQVADAAPAVDSEALAPLVARPGEPAEASPTSSDEPPVKAKAKQAKVKKEKAKPVAKAESPAPEEPPVKAEQKPAKPLAGKSERPKPAGVFDRGEPIPADVPADDSDAATIKADRPIQGWDESKPVIHPTRAVDEQGTSTVGRRAPSWSEIERPAAGLAPAPTVAPAKGKGAAPKASPKPAAAPAQAKATPPKASPKPAAAPAQAKASPPKASPKSAATPAKDTAPKVSPMAASPKPAAAPGGTGGPASSDQGSASLQDLRQRTAALRAKLGLPEEGQVKPASSGGAEPAAAVSPSVEERLAELRRKVGLEPMDPDQSSQ